MELSELINSVKAISVTGNIQRKDISGIEYDSRNVSDGSVFVAIKGFTTDGHKFIPDVLNKGAIAVVLQDDEKFPDDLFNHNNTAKILVEDSRKALAELSTGFYRNPSGKLKLIGITGTNGKTTTAYFVKSILETAGFKTGLSGTISNVIGQKEVKSTLTTPEANDLNKLLFEMNNEGCSYAVMEVSSHSLYLNRVYGLNFNSAIFTNITSEHLDFHGTFENYLEAKKILFKSLNESAFGVINIDDNYSDAFTKISNAKNSTYGISSNADFIIKNIEYDLNGTRFIIEHSGNDYLIDTTLVGEFNAYNACAAFAVTYLNGIKEDNIVEGIKNTKQVPGRFEVVGKKKKVIIDYSHTEDSLKKTLQAINQIVKNERPVYTVFGCGGNRDKSKRPKMGKVATELSKKAFVTSDNPRNEEPEKIIDEIIEGIERDNFEKVIKREEAIKKAIEGTEDNAVILIAGKGHETYQEINGKRSHFSDKEFAEKYLNQ